MRLLSTALLLSLCFGCSDSFDAEHYLEAGKQYDVTIERDYLGVPHVLGKRDVDAAFGLAYAQAEDNWTLVQDSVPLYRGTNAKYNGPDAAVLDFLIGWLGIWDTIDAQYETDLTPQTRAYVEAFADGINYYAALHPKQINPDLFPMTGKDVVAGFVLRHLLFYGFDGVVKELNEASRKHPISQPNSVSIGGLPIGSNAIAIAPWFSDDGATRLAINSHQPTTGPVAWYEAHIQSGQGLNIMGGLFPGSPTISLGFTNNLAWGVTVNRPDLVDVYVLDTHPDNPNQYKIDGEWQELEQTDIDIQVTLWGFLPWTVTETAYRSVHGPVMVTDHGTYAVRYAGMGEIRQVQQWLDMNKAKDFSQWRAAMGTHSFASFNFVYADKEGNTMFVHNSLTPKRAPGYNWQQYLPGDNSDLIWQDYIAFEDLPQVINPASGYVISANQTPFRVSAEIDNPDPDSYQPQDGFPTRMTNRAHRGLELLQSLGPISEQEFFDIKHDKSYSKNSRVAQYINRVSQLELSSTEAEIYHQAQQVLQSWDWSTDTANTGAALGVCIVTGEWQAEQTGATTPQALSELKRCTDMLMTHVGTLTPKWGSINRHVRGEVNVPVGGGPDTLRAIYGRGLEEDGFLTNRAGDGLYYLVSWDQSGQLKVRGTHHFGSATLDETSVHYADQAQAYANESLHDPLFDPLLRKAQVKKRYQPGQE